MKKTLYIAEVAIGIFFIAVGGSDIQLTTGAIMIAIGINALVK